MVYGRSMGVVRYARTLLRMPEPQKWAVDMIRDMLTTPWALHESEAPGIIHHKSTTQVEVAQNKPAQVRRLYILPEDLEAHGYTKNCTAPTPAPCRIQKSAEHSSQRRSARHQLGAYESRI